MSTNASAPAGIRFAPVDSDHHGAILWIILSLSLTYFLLSCIVRLFLSYRNFTRDAGVLVAATIIGFVQVIVVYAQLAAGFGTAIGLLSSSQVLRIQKYEYAATLLYIVTATLAKLSVVLLEARLTPPVVYQRICTILAAVCSAWGICSLFALAVKCAPAEPWITVAADCPNILLRWQIISALDFVLEAAIFAVIVGLVYNLQMARTKKFAVVCGFAFRLPLIALAMVHLSEIRNTIDSTNATYDYISPSAVMAVQMGWSLVSATIIRLKSFMETLESGYLGATLNNNLGSYAVDTGSHSASRDARRGGTRDEAFEMRAVKSPDAASKTGNSHFKSHHAELAQDNVSISSAARVSNDGSQDPMVRRVGEEPHQGNNVV